MKTKEYILKVVIQDENEIFTLETVIAPWIGMGVIESVSILEETNK